MAKAQSLQPSASRHALSREFLQQLVFPALLLLIVFVFGTLGFFILGGGRWSFFDCAYMTSITLTTVGYGEILEDFGTNGRSFAMVLMWAGMGVALYAVSTITGFVVERKFSRILRERKMEKRIAALKDHFIVCGGGHTAVNVLRELITSNRSCVSIEMKLERIEWIANQFPDHHFIQGDATEEEVLLRAGIERASGILAVLAEDSHNLLITVQARYINPDIKIVARCSENNLADKFYRAGANYVVNPSFIGGMRMASEMIRPNVVSFLDRMLRGIDRVDTRRGSHNSRRVAVGRQIAARSRHSAHDWADSCFSKASRRFRFHLQSFPGRGPCTGIGNSRHWESRTDIRSQKILCKGK